MGRARRDVGSGARRIGGAFRNRGDPHAAGDVPHVRRCIPCALIIYYIITRHSAHDNAGGMMDIARRQYDHQFSYWMTEEENRQLVIVAERMATSKAALLRRLVGDAYRRGEADTQGEA